MSAQSDPRIGSWKLDLAKSKYTRAPAPQGETRIYEMSGGTLMVHTVTIMSDGSKQECSFNGTADGKSHAYTCAPYSAPDTITTKGKGKAISAQIKNGGKVLSTTTDSYSADGKVRTMTSKGVNDKGQSISSVRVYDKQ